MARGWNSLHKNDDVWILGWKTGYDILNAADINNI